MSALIKNVAGLLGADVGSIVYRIYVETIIQSIANMKLLRDIDWCFALINKHQKSKKINSPDFSLVLCQRCECKYQRVNRVTYSKGYDDRYIDLCDKCIQIITNNTIVYKIGLDYYIHYY